MICSAVVRDCGWGSGGQGFESQVFCTHKEKLIWATAPDKIASPVVWRAILPTLVGLCFMFLYSRHYLLKWLSLLAIFYN